MSVFFVLLIISPFIGSYGFLKYQQYKVMKEIKRRMVAGIGREELVELRFSTADAAALRWEHAKEFEFGGEMYDIVERHQSGDTLIFHCWWDHDETRLSKQLSVLVAEAMGQNKTTRQHKDDLSIFFKSLYCEHFYRWETAPGAFEKAGFPLSMASAASVYLEMPFPPPRTA